jgi:hypothetical protein
MFMTPAFERINREVWFPLSPKRTEREIQIVADYLAHAFHVDRRNVALFYLDRRGSVLKYLHPEPFSRMNATLPYDSKKSIVAKTLQEGRVWIDNRLFQVNPLDFFHSRTVARPTRNEKTLIVPIRFEGAPLGAVQISRPQKTSSFNIPESFSAADVGHVKKVENSLRSLFREVRSTKALAA